MTIDQAAGPSDSVYNKGPQGVVDSTDLCIHVSIELPSSPKSFEKSLKDGLQSGRVSSFWRRRIQPSKLTYQLSPFEHGRVLLATFKP